MESQWVEIQANIEEKITDFLREKLNDNSYGINFNLGFWTYKDGSEGRYIDVGDPDNPKEPNPQEKDIPTVIEVFDGNILGIEGLFNTEYTAPMQFQITADNTKMMMEAVQAIEEVKHSLRGQMFRWRIEYGDDEYEYFNAVTSTDNLSPMGDIDEQMGERYVFAQMNIDFSISKDILYGNQVAIFMREHEENPDNYQRIYPISPSTSRENTPKSIENFGSINEIQNIIDQTSYNISMGLYVKDDKLHSELKKDIMVKERLNKPFDIKVVFYKYDGENLIEDFVFEDVITILEGEVSYAIGEEQFMSLGFGKYLPKARYYWK